MVAHFSTPVIDRYAIQSHCDQEQAVLVTKDGFGTMRMMYDIVCFMDGWAMSILGICDKGCAFLSNN